MRSTTYCLFVEGMLYDMLLNVEVYVFIFACKTHSSMLEFMCSQLHVKLTFLLCYSFSQCFVVGVGQVVEVAKSNSLRPTRLNSATVRKW